MKGMIHACRDNAMTQVVCMPQPPTEPTWVVHYTVLSYFTSGEEAEGVPCPVCDAWCALAEIAEVEL